MTPAAPPINLSEEPDRMVVMADLPRLSTHAAFDYFTVPELLTRWWPQEAIVEPRVGGHYRLLWPSMNWELTGHYTSFEPGQRLAFTWWWTHQPELPVRHVEATFAPAGVGCRVTISHGSYGDTAAEQEDRQGHIDGWIFFLGQLQAIE
jgi:uncharacterized protein YndB with AHSA1/START domain